jgi:integrase
MLSFYLVGMNTIDLYNINDFKDGRLNYNRTKTKHRTDKAFISIKVEPEAFPLLEKYKDQTGKRVFNFYLRYKSPKVFSMSMAIGLGKICKNKEITEKITVYYARHSWATIARNICRISKDDVHFSLNHSDPDMKVTDLYIEEDFSIIDEANRKVLDTLI